MPEEVPLTLKEKAAFEQRKKMLVCRSAFVTAGLQGGAVSGGLALLGVTFLPRFMSARAQKNLPLNIRAFLVSAAFVAGFWIHGEPASNACARDTSHIKQSEVEKVFDGQI